MPLTLQEGHTSPHRGEHEVLRFWAAEFNSDGRPLVKNVAVENPQPASSFSESFGRFLFAAEDAFMITA